MASKNLLYTGLDETLAPTSLYAGENNATALIVDFSGCNVDTYAKWVRFSNSEPIYLGLDVIVNYPIPLAFMALGRLEVQPYAIGPLGEVVKFAIRGIPVNRTLEVSDGNLYDPTDLESIQTAVSEMVIQVDEIWTAYENDELGGDSAYEIVVQNGFVGTEVQWLASLEGTDGTNGTNGINGTNGTNGIDGDNGLSAFEVAVANGFIGTEAEWLVSLIGGKGDDGDSAYQIAVAGGFVGTEAEWLLSLNGTDGMDGADAVAGKLPSSYAELSAPAGVTAATLIDVPSMVTTITLDEAVEIAVFASFEMQTISGATNSVIEVAIQIDGVDHDPLRRYLSGSNDLGMGAITHRSDELPAGTYTVKLRFRRVSGTSTPALNKAHMLVMAMQGAKGTDGQGVPVGGVLGDLLIKQSATYADATWQTPPFIKSDGSNSAITLLTFVGGGALQYNTDQDGLEVVNPDGTTLRVGSETVYDEGKATEAILNGDNVMLAGSQGDHYLYKKAVASELATNPNLYLGVATMDIPLNSFGKVTNFGLIHDLNTSAWAYGTELWYNPSTNGLTSVQPPSTGARINVGMVIVQHASAGIILVRPSVMKGYTIAEVTTLLSGKAIKPTNEATATVGQILEANGDGTSTFVDLITSVTTDATLSGDGTPANPLSVVNNGWKSINATLTYASADSPTFVANTSIDLTSVVSVGMKLKLTQTTVKYFIVTEITSTTITLYGGTDYTLANASITLPCFSSMKAPFGFPLNSDKWSVIVVDTTERSQLASGTTIYNLGGVNIVIPIGLWEVSYSVLAQIGDYNSIAGDRYMTVSLSNANNTLLPNTSASLAGTPLKVNRSFVQRNMLFNLTSKTTYYLNSTEDTGGGNVIYNTNQIVALVLKAVCAYL